jgi:hypothetical protein
LFAQSFFRAAEGYSFNIIKIRELGLLRLCYWLAMPRLFRICLVGILQNQGWNQRLEGVKGLQFHVKELRSRLGIQKMANGILQK